MAAPIGYGSKGPHRLPSALFGYFPRNETVLLCLCITVSFKKTYAIPPLNTTQSGKLPSFVATVSRRHPPETIPKPCVPLSFWQNLHHGSSAIAFSIPLLPPFSCVMDAGAEAGVEGVVFAARRAREILVVGFTRLLANRGLTRKQRRRLRVLHRAFQPNWTSSSLSLCVRTDPAAPCTPCFRMCWSVKRPSFHRHVEK